MDNAIVLVEGLWPQPLDDFLDSARGRIYMEEMSKVLNVYVCQRKAEAHFGALIIAAPNTLVAVEVYHRTEPWHLYDPYAAMQLQGVTATGEPRVLWDDYSR